MGILPISRCDGCIGAWPVVNDSGAREVMAGIPFQGMQAIQGAKDLPFAVHKHSERKELQFGEVLVAAVTEEGRLVQVRLGQQPQGCFQDHDIGGSPVHCESCRWQLVGPQHRIQDLAGELEDQEGLAGLLVRLGNHADAIGGLGVVGSAQQEVERQVALFLPPASSPRSQAATNRPRA